MDPRQGRSRGIVAFPTDQLPLTERVRERMFDDIPARDKSRHKLKDTSAHRTNASYSALGKGSSYTVQHIFSNVSMRLKKWHHVGHLRHGTLTVRTSRRTFLDSTRGTGL